MSAIQKLSNFEQIKLLADPRRLAILRELMSAPATLTQLGRVLNRHPAWVRYHLKLMEQSGLVEIVETRVTAGVTEKYYRARASGLMMQELIRPGTSTHPVIVFTGSHDLALELLVKMLSNQIDILTFFVGSMDGLVALRQGLCHLAGTHLLDKNGEYNVPFVQHIFPDRPMRVVTLAHREQGLMTASGNPKAINELSDLARAGVTFINRNPGSGTRLWLDRQLWKLDLPARSISGYFNEASTHTDCARAVQNGEGDVALGLRAAAHQYRLGFVPLFHERYDLVFSEEQAGLLDPLLETIRTPEFRRGIQNLTGYQTTHTGEQISL
jgi:putative molybdopterin biosynthesis protein